MFYIFETMYITCLFYLIIIYIYLVIYHKSLKSVIAIGKKDENKIPAISARIHLHLKCPPGFLDELIVGIQHLKASSALHSSPPPDPFLSS